MWPPLQTLFLKRSSSFIDCSKKNFQKTFYTNYCVTSCKQNSQRSSQEPRKYPTSHVPIVEDELVNGLWEELKQRKLEAQKDKPPCLEEIDFDQKTLVLELRSKLADAAFEKTMESTRGTLRMLPSFQGDYEAKSKTKKIPSQQHQPPKILDVGNLIELLATPIKCTLPLAVLLKAKPKLWKEVGKCLKHIRIDL